VEGLGLVEVLLGRGARRRIRRGQTQRVVWMLQIVTQQAKVSHD